MTARTDALTTTSSRQRQARLLGFGTVFRKEIQDWLRGRRAVVVGASAVVVAIFTVLVPFIVKAFDRMGTAPDFGTDPTVNVLRGWGMGTVTFQAFLVVLATIALMTVERDRGTLQWTLTNPVSRRAFLIAKWAAAVAVIGAVSVFVPLAIQVVVAAVVYGGIADLPVVFGFGVLYLAVPAFYVALNLASGTVLRSTVGVAAIGMAVIFLPSLLFPIVPVLADFSPTSIHSWAFGLVTGGPVAWSLPVVTLVSIALLGAGAIRALDGRDL